VKQGPVCAAEHVTEQVLFETFSRAGSIQSVRLCRESNSRKSLGYGYINYRTPQEGASAGKGASGVGAGGGGGNAPAPGPAVARCKIGFIGWGVNII